MQLGEGVTGWVAQHQSPVALTSKAPDDARFKPIAGLVEDTYQAFLSVPVVTRGKAIGVINVHHRDPHEHSADEIAAVTFIGEQTASALGKILLEDENARLAERDQQSERQRTLLQARRPQGRPQLNGVSTPAGLGGDRQVHGVSGVSKETRAALSGGPERAG